MSDDKLTPDVFRRARTLILPFVNTVDDREVLLADAFYLSESRLYHNIEREGSPKIFSSTCVRMLIDYGCLVEGEHALARLLNTVRLDCGVDKHPEIDDLVSITNTVCQEDKPSGQSSTILTLPVDPAPIQTIETPRDERLPTVFISYSHVDMAFADKLIADLQKVGHPCWIDKSKIKGGDEWIMTISEGIINSYAFVPILSRKAMDSSWVRKEILWAVDKKKLIVPVILEDVFDHPFFFLLKDVQGMTVFDSSYEVLLPKLLSYLPAPSLPVIELEVEPEESKKADDFFEVDDVVKEETAPARDREMPAMPPSVAPIPAAPPSPISPRRSVPRKLELAYMERLRLEELLNSEKYTALGGVSQQAQKAEMRAVFELLPMSRDPEMRSKSKPFEDAVSEIQRLKRAVLLGEPGGGKTTTLWKLADDLIEQALKDRTAPIPILIRLGKWTEANQPLPAFIAAQMGDLWPYLPILLQEKRAALLLDGLNEIPVSQRMGRDTLKNKTEQVQQFVEANADLLAVVSCRELDYTLDLGFDRINITPLDPIRIHEFVERYLGEEKGDDLFWKLAGESARWYYSEIMTDLSRNGIEQGRLERLFWLETTVPTALQPTDYKGDKRNPYAWEDWLKVREHPSSLMKLARNPYMLLMLTSVYADEGQLPANRGQLFAKFVEKLLEREAIPEAEQPALLEKLAELAYEMQTQRAQMTEEGDALTVLPDYEVRNILGERLLYLAGSASILSIGEQVRFTQQLLQEYFAATAMDERIKSGRLSAREIWKTERWWLRTNWEEAVILLAGLYTDDPTPVVTWLMDANPEVAAQCINRSGAVVPPDETLLKLRETWIPRLTDLSRDPMPEARAAVGRALGQLALSDGTPLDNRKGVAFTIKEGVKLPDIDWVEIPGGEFIYGDESEDNGPQTLGLPTFHISRYPVTMTQYQTFLDDPEGFADPRWFEGLLADEYSRQNREQHFKFSNHPRERVNWYQAMAFCRWFSWRLGGSYALDKIDDWLVRLPTEFEWEKAARGTDGREYPWGSGYLEGYANIDETYNHIGLHNLGVTSAIGIYPQGKSSYGVLDMSGNVSEWIFDVYNIPQKHDSNNNRRLDNFGEIRGGSWSDNDDDARAAEYGNSQLDICSPSFGFRLCRPL